MLLTTIRNNGVYRKIGLAILDAILIVLAYITTPLFSENEFYIMSEPFLHTSVVAIVIYLSLFYAFKVYKSITKYSGARDYIIIGFACLISASILSTFRQLSPVVIYGTRRNILAAFIVSFYCVTYRVFMRSILDGTITLKHKKHRRKVLIIGGGSATARLVKDVFPILKKEYKIVGIIDDNENMANCAISGVGILGDRNSIIKICERERIDLILFAIANISEESKKQILNICTRTKAQIKIIPNIAEIIRSDKAFKISQLKDVEIEDLLGRNPIILDNKEISEFITGKTVLVTGGGGSIGSELCRQISGFKPKQLIIVDIYENTLYSIELELRKKYPDMKLESIISSVRDTDKIEQIFEKYKPELVFHAAAHKHVPLMETSPEEAIKNNVFGTLNVANSSIKNNVEKFVLISTDKAVNPTSIMGATKRICEMIIQSKNAESNTEFVAVRFGNVLGSNGSVIPIFNKQIKEGGPVTVTHKDITRYFMTIPEAVGLILQATTYAGGGEIFVLDMGEPVKIYDLAENLIRLAGFEPNVDINIEITGLRPGEKLYEELLVSEEGLVKTMHEKIMVSKITGFNQKTLYSNLDILKESVTDNVQKKKTEYIKLIKKMVPSFIEQKKENKSSGNPKKQSKKKNKNKKVEYVFKIETVKNKADKLKASEL